MKFVRRVLALFRYYIFGTRVPRDLVIVRFDGGVCSQIGFWALGRDIEHKGFKVKYDLSWYEEHGKDCLGKFNRNFDLAKVFPSHDFQIATHEEVFFYKRRFNNENNDVSEISPPAYLGGYYDRFPLIVKHRDCLQRMFEPDKKGTDEYNEKMLSCIAASRLPCAVHVRRGDLAVFNEAYGHPLGPDYFIHAINEIRSLYKEATFFLFSDEPDWVREELLPALQHTQTIIVDGNDSDAGFLDLMLMSRCKVFVASQGSLAKYARVLCKEPSPLLYEPDSKRLFKLAMTENVVTVELEKLDV